jgi:HD-like signal output (HDOD) protein
MTITFFRGEMKEGMTVKVLAPGQADPSIQAKPSKKEKFLIGKIHHFGRVPLSTLNPTKCHSSFAHMAYVQGPGLNRWVSYDILGVV